MIHCEYVNGDAQAVEFSVDQLPKLLDKDEGLVWIDIADPDDDDFQLLESTFHFHPLAIEDVQKGGQRAKVVEYDRYVFVVMHELQPDPHTALSVPCVRHSAEIHAFVGPNYCVTVHREASKCIDITRRRWGGAKDLQALGSFALLYLLLDTVVDEYFPSLDAFDDRIDLLEQFVLKPAVEDVRVLAKTDGRDNGDVLTSLVALRRNLLETRRYIAPLRDAVNILLRRAEALETDQVARDTGRAQKARTLFAYYQDVYDHTIRQVDTVDTYRDLLSGTLDAHLAVASNRLNEIVKVLTSVSIILMTWAGITGLYGMNFAYMPELHWKYGYLYFWALVIVSGVFEWMYFRRRKWL